MTDETLSQETLPESPAPETSIPDDQPTGGMEDTIRETYRQLTAPPEESVERARGADGRFVSARPEFSGSNAGAMAQQTPEAESATTAQPPTEGGNQEEVSPPSEHPWTEPPNTWRKETAGLFKDLPDAVKQEVHRRESDFHRGISEYRDAAAFGRSIFEDVSPHFETMRQLGSTPREVVRDVLGAWQQLATGTPEQKQATFLRLADGYGIDLSELLDARDRAPSNSPELTPVLQRIEQLESTLTQAQRAQAESAWQGQVEQAQKFLTDPAREFMPQVVDDVIALVRAGYDPDEAYNKAIWAHPDTRAKLLSKQENERRQREAAETARARKAATVNVTRRGTPPAVEKPGSMEDTIRQTLRKING